MILIRKWYYPSEAWGLKLAAAAAALSINGLWAASIADAQQIPTGTGTSGLGANERVFKYVQVGDIKIAYRTVGQGQPLVMIMGFSGTMDEWDPALIDRLAKRFRVVLFDNRGMGLSNDVPGNRLTIRQMADDTAGLIKALRLRSAHVLGWSMGGYVGQELVLRYPRLVRRMVLAGTDTGGKHAVQPTQQVLDMLSDPNSTPEQLLSILFPANRQDAGAAYLQRISTQPPPYDFTVDPKALRNQERASDLWAGPHGGSFERLPRIRRPVLVSDGLDDVVVPPENSRIIAKRIPNATLKLYRDSGHAFLFQDNSAFARAVTRHLRR